MITTRDVLGAILTMAPGQTFTVADLAERMGADRRAIARILARGGVGAELVEIRRELKRYPCAHPAPRDTRIYRRASP